MSKRLMAFGLVLALAFCLLCFPALADDARVFDRADLFTANEEAEIEAAIYEFQMDTGMDFVVVTSDEAHGKVTQTQIADAFYERGDFGFDEQKSGLCYYIDMYDRQEYLSTAGVMQDYINNDRLDAALDQSNPKLRKSDFAGAALSMIASVDRFYKEGIPEGQYRYDDQTGERLTATHKVVTGGELLICAAIAAVVGLIFIMGVRSRYKLKGSTYEYDYGQNVDMKLTQQQDTYLRTTVTRSPKAPPPESRGGGGGGSFGSGSGSGVHMSSGGVSHGGGGRGF